MELAPPSPSWASIVKRRLTSSILMEIGFYLDVCRTKLSRLVRTSLSKNIIIVDCRRGSDVPTPLLLDVASCMNLVFLV